MPGLKVCKETADKIRSQVEKILLVTPNIPLEIAKNMRHSADVDADIHKYFDPEFKWGNGPGVERHG